MLTDLQGFHGAAHTQPDDELHLRFDKNGAMSYGCTAAQAVVGTGTLDFVQKWLTATNTNCPHLDLQQNQFVFARLLTGTARWRISDGTLTVYHGTRAATFQRDATS